MTEVKDLNLDELKQVMSHLTKGKGGQVDGQWLAGQLKAAGVVRAPAPDTVPIAPIAPEIRAAYNPNDFLQENKINLNGPEAAALSKLLQDHPELNNKVSLGRIINASEFGSSKPSHYHELFQAHPAKDHIFSSSVDTAPEAGRELKMAVVEELAQKDPAQAAAELAKQAKNYGPGFAKILGVTGNYEDSKSYLGVAQRLAADAAKPMLQRDPTLLAQLGRALRGVEQISENKANLVGADHDFRLGSGGRYWGLDNGKPVLGAGGVGKVVEIHEVKITPDQPAVAQPTQNVWREVERASARDAAGHSYTAYFSNNGEVVFADQTAHIVYNGTGVPIGHEVDGKISLADADQIKVKNVGPIKIPGGHWPINFREESVDENGALRIRTKAVDINSMPPPSRGSGGGGGAARLLDPFRQKTPGEPLVKLKVNPFEGPVAKGGGAGAVVEPTPKAPTVDRGFVSAFGDEKVPPKVTTGKTLQSFSAETGKGTVTAPKVEQIVTTTGAGRETIAGAKIFTDAGLQPEVAQQAFQRMAVGLEQKINSIDFSQAARYNGHMELTQKLHEMQAHLAKLQTGAETVKPQDTTLVAAIRDFQVSNGANVDNGIKALLAQAQDGEQRKEWELLLSSHNPQSEPVVANGGHTVLVWKEDLNKYQAAFTPNMR